MQKSDFYCRHAKKTPQTLRQRCKCIKNKERLRRKKAPLRLSKASLELRILQALAPPTITNAIRGGVVTISEL
jgi:hypothetical protein